MQPLTFAHAPAQQVAIVFQNVPSQFYSPPVNVMNAPVPLNHPTSSRSVVVQGLQSQPNFNQCLMHKSPPNPSTSAVFTMATDANTAQLQVPSLPLLAGESCETGQKTVGSSCAPSSQILVEKSHGKRPLDEKDEPPSKRCRTASVENDLSDAELLAKQSSITLQDLLDVNLSKPIVQRSQYIHVTDNAEKQRRRKEQNNKSAARARSYMKSVSELVHVFQKALREEHQEKTELAQRVEVLSQSIQQKDAELAKFRAQFGGVS